MLTELSCGYRSSMVGEDRSLDLEGFKKQLQSLFKSFKNCTWNIDHGNGGKTFCSEFRKLVEEYTCRWQTPLPRLRILEVAVCYFVRGSSLFGVGCEDVRSMLSSLALSVFELLLFFDKEDFDKDPLKHFTVTFQECCMCLARHQNVHMIQVNNCLQDGGPWANATLQSILTQGTLPQTDVDRYIRSQLPVLLELRLRYLLTCERVSEAMALAKCCSRHPTAGQHHFFLQVYLTCLHKTSQHDRLNKEVGYLNSKDAVQIICNMESEEEDESILILTRAFLSQQLRRGDMAHLSDLVFLWIKLQLRLQTSKQVLLEEIQQLMLTATNVNSIFPFIRVILEQLGKEGHQFCVELCTKALQSCLPCDVLTKSLIYKTLAGLFPNDLEMCQVCALLVFFLERTVQAFKKVFSLYIHRDQEDHTEASPVGNHVRIDTLLVLKKALYFDPETLNLSALKARCLNLLIERVDSDAIEESLVPDSCTMEPALHLNTHSSTVQQRTNAIHKAAEKRWRTKDDNNHMATKRFKASSDKAARSSVDLAVKEKRNAGSRSVREASTKSFRRSLRQLEKEKENSLVYHKQITQLSEKKPAKQNIKKPQWLIDPERPEESTLSHHRKLRSNGDMPYLSASVGSVGSNSASAKSHPPQTSGAQNSHKASISRLGKIKRDKPKKGRKLNEDASSKTPMPQVNTNDQQVMETEAVSTIYRRLRNQTNVAKYTEPEVPDDGVRSQSSQVQVLSCFSHLKDLTTHHRIHTGEKPFHCKHCDKSFIYSSHLNRHHRVHTGEKPFHCKHCDKSFTSSHSLKTHHHVHTGENPFHCKHCDKSFTSSHSLKTHHRVHTGEKTFHCKHCDKSFTCSSSLKTHHRVHTGEKPFHCKNCDKSFTCSSSLKTHHRVHTGEKPFHCKHCDKSFTSSHSLKTHHRVHTGETPFHCKHCDKSFICSSHLNRHHRVHTGEKPFQCKHCDKRFSQSHELNTHKCQHT